MKNLMWRLCLMAAFAGLAWFGRATPACGAEDRADGTDRMERLERRVNEMAERQQQMMGNMGGQMERQGRQGMMGRQGSENFRPPMARQGNDGILPPMTGPGGPKAVSPHPAEARHMKGLHDLLGLLFLIGIITNILLAIWIFTDIRRRGEGSGIFIAMALVAGIPVALIYALTRLGDKKTQP